MREHDDDFDDFELDDNEVVNRLMREWEMEDRRKAKGAKRTRARILRAPPVEEADDDLDDDCESYDDFDDFDDDY